MEVIAVVETDDGDKSVFVHPRQITLTKLDDQYLKLHQYFLLE